MIEQATTMLALRKTRAEAGMELVEVPVPQTLEEGEVLVRVAAAGICGSDLHVDDWTTSYAFIAPYLPVTLGHEFVGTIASGPRLGQRVVVRPSVTCGRCTHCLAENFDACEQRRGIGMTRDGAFAAWVRAPLRNCIPVPAGVSDALASLVEPFSIAMQAVRQAGELAGRTVLVMGPGTIGQAIAVLARRMGAARIVVTGFQDAVRLDTLRAMGFDEVVDVAQTPLTQWLKTRADVPPFDLVFEATGVPATITEALGLLRRDGVVVVTGIHDRPLSLDLTPFVRRQLQLRGSFRPPESDWPRVLDLMGELGESIRPMVSHVLPLTRAHEGLALAHGKQANKVLLVPEDHDGR
ncbi:zinc-dependent alcohol dehydrogenase [Hylemonella gracilis]|uniref:Alcohol dehydrogenase n=1 Tax=Hylemonella gracilis ATCC 19624 TaxID=887062 RepID=F3KU20_9BURK|nr:alcohol dehydrogenase catalytic domain-containing protein [Hylemonella gracilis]EGI76703.1 alcohol dehydrogenase [Hylemonella gracilis ATCC 19624]